MSFLAERFSYFFQRQLASAKVAAGQLETLCSQPVDEAVILALLEAMPMRRARNLVLMALMERDLQGLAPLEEICRAMTLLAEHCCRLSFQAAAADLASQYGPPLDTRGQVQDLMVVAMGKAGAYELNVSSDLDLVLVYRDQGETRGTVLMPDGTTQPSPRGVLSASEFFHQVGRKAIRELADLTEDGFVFRIDTRLRPNGDAGPLVVSLPMLEQYFIVQGREWERFAWLKSRIMADTGLQAASGLDHERDWRDLRSIVEPFVFRRYIDYRVFDGLKDLHRTIRQEAGKKDVKAPGTIDVKLGEGGIREVEFIAQMFQIVRGGRDAGLRDPATLITLQALAQRQLLQADEAEALADAYRLLRRIEHAAQYVDDQQTHRIPAPGEARLRIAAMLGLSIEAFEATLASARTRVQGVFEALLQEPAGNGRRNGNGSGSGNGNRHGNSDGKGSGSAGQADAEPALELPERVRERFEAFCDGPRHKTASAETQQAVQTLMQRALAWTREGAQREQALAEGWQDKALLRLIDFLEVVCRRPSYIALVARFPLAFERVLEMLAQSSWASQYLNQHPIVLDELLDGRLFEPPELGQWQAQLDSALQAAGQQGRTDLGPDVERQMDTARELHHALVFKLLAQDLKGLWSVEHLSDLLSDAADRTLQSALALIWQQLPRRFRDQPRFAVIAYGKLGGKELGYASDLDLVFLHDDEDERAQEAYAQLAQRLSSWLSTRTQAGIVFEIDLRLRPNGNAGLLVTSLKGFERYQREKAWTWELQALTRARFCAGDAAIGRAFEAMRSQLLAVARDTAQLRQDVIEMRQKMLDGHPNRSELFDLKHDRGGMVDIEFIVQYLVLAHSHQYPELARNLGNIALLGLAGEQGLIPAELADQCQQAYRLFRRRQHTLRLNELEYARVPQPELLAQRQAVQALWQQLFGAPGP